MACTCVQSHKGRRIAVFFTFTLEVFGVPVPNWGVSEYGVIIHQVLDLDSVAFTPWKRPMFDVKKLSSIKVSQVSYMTFRHDSVSGWKILLLA